MKFESRKVVLNHTQQETFDHLSKIENYEKLIPDDAEFSLHESGKGFGIQLKGLPKVGLKLKEIQSPEFILFESPNDNFVYEMKVNISLLNENTSETTIDFNGKFNPMIEMMAKKPLTSLIETIANNLEKKGLS